MERAQAGSMRSLTRRALCAGATAAGLVTAVGAGPALAVGNATTRGAAWYIGSNLSIAALFYAQGAPPETVDKFLSKAKNMAKTAGIEIKPFPPRGATSSETMVAVYGYMLQGDGWEVGRTLARKFEPDHGTLFELAVKSGLLTIPYQPADDSGLGEMIKSGCETLDLPPELWTPATDAIAAKKDPEVVRDIVFKMHDDVTKFLFNG